MTSPGDRRPPSRPPPRPDRGAAPSIVVRLRPRSLGAAIAEAAAIGLLSALAWTLLKGILELGIGLLVVAAFGGWTIGAVLGQVRSSPLLALALAAVVWLAGLVGTWLLAMAILPASTRSFPERLAATPFTDWLSPQFGLIEVAGLVVYLIAAGYGARPRSGAAPTR